jgi:hypothetical protein
MKTDHTLASRGFRFGLVSSALLVAATVGCTGQISGEPGGMPPVVTGGSGNTSGGGGGGNSQSPVNGTDPGRIAIHRLNNLEYANTVMDLMGVAANTGNFQNNDGKGDSFDNIASEFGVTDQQYSDYFNSAVDIATRAFADKTAMGKVLTCTPAAATDTACIKTIIQTWGLRAWRRPITDAEVTSLTAIATGAMGMGFDGPTAIQQVVTTMLASPMFLFRIEYDPDPTSTTPHQLDPYELASRLSYLHWSTMPDKALFDLAASGDISKDATLTAQVDRLLADPKGQTFTQEFAGQWLGMQTLLTHAVSAAAFPSFNDSLKQAMYQEGLLYFQDFLMGNSQMKDFFTAKINFVNNALAPLYGVAGITGAPLQKVTNMAPNRMGFMGLASFLTQSSLDYRTAPTLRGKWVLENLLCQELPPKPNTPIPDLDAAGNAMNMAQSENVAMRLAAHRSMDAGCAACHATLDPIGLGLENFDAIGQYRTTYADGEVVDPSGIYDMKPFKGLSDLTGLLADPSSKYAEQLKECATKKLMTFSLSRIMGSADDPYIKKIAYDWGGGGMKDLLKKVVLSQPFRYRHGEAPM